MYNNLLYVCGRAFYFSSTFCLNVLENVNALVDFREWDQSGLKLLAQTSVLFLALLVSLIVIAHSYKYKQKKKKTLLKPFLLLLGLWFLLFLLFLVKARWAAEGPKSQMWPQSVTCRPLLSSYHVSFYSICHFDLWFCVIFTTTVPYNTLSCSHVLPEDFRHLLCFTFRKLEPWVSSSVLDELSEAGSTRVHQPPPAYSRSSPSPAALSSHGRLQAGIWWQDCWSVWPR